MNCLSRQTSNAIAWLVGRSLYLLITQFLLFSNFPYPLFYAFFHCLISTLVLMVAAQHPLFPRVDISFTNTEHRSAISATITTYLLSTLFVYLVSSFFFSSQILTAECRYTFALYESNHLCSCFML